MEISISRRWGGIKVKKVPNSSYLFVSPSSCLSRNLSSPFIYPEFGASRTSGTFPWNFALSTPGVGDNLPHIPTLLYRIKFPTQQVIKGCPSRKPSYDLAYRRGEKSDFLEKHPTIKIQIFKRGVTCVEHLGFPFLSLPVGRQVYPPMRYPSLYYP